MRTIKELLELDGLVYVHLKDAEIGKKFLESAELEGFVFDDGEKPTNRVYATIMALHDNKKEAELDAEFLADTGFELDMDYEYRFTINYVGHVGQMAFQAAKEVDGRKLYCIDYESYAVGKENYFYID